MRAKPPIMRVCQLCVMRAKKAHYAENYALQNSTKNMKNRKKSKKIRKKKNSKNFEKNFEKISKKNWDFFWKNFENFSKNFRNFLTFFFWIFTWFFKILEIFCDFPRKLCDCIIFFWKRSIMRRNMRRIMVHKKSPLCGKICAHNYPPPRSQPTIVNPFKKCNFYFLVSWIK